MAAIVRVVEDRYHGIMEALGGKSLAEELHQNGLCPFTGHLHFYFILCPSKRDSYARALGADTPIR